MLKKFIGALTAGEDFLLERLYRYAHEAEYTRYISTREEDWRIIITETCRNLARYLEGKTQPDPIHANENFKEHPVSAFGILEARRHRERGVSLDMFLGLLKLVQQAVADLAYDIGLDTPEHKMVLFSVRRFFDKFELGLCSEWVGHSESEKIRELQETNRTLTNEKNRFYTIFNNISEPAYVVDPARTIVNVNQALKSFMGKKDEELVGKKCRAVFGFSMCASCPLEESFNNITGFSGRETTLNTGGETKNILVYGAGIDDISGQNTGGIILFSDITERKNAEEELKRSEERIRSLITKNVDAIVVVGHQGTVNYANPAAEELFGVSADKLIGSTFGFPMGKEEGTEINILGRDGAAARVAEMRVSESKWEGEDVYLASLRDITDRKNAEKEKEQMQRQLRQAQKMEALGTLSGGIAHDFNNILSAIIGYSELCKGLAGRETKLKDYLDEVLTAANRATELVRQILTFSRQSDIEAKPFMIKFQIKEALHLLRATLPASIKILQYVDCDALVLGDPTQIQQIMMNLCVNAGHAMREAGGTLEVRLSEVDAGAHLMEKIPELKQGKYVCLSVRDSGHGMDKTTLERIFDPYFTTKGKGEGTGLGLAVVHGIVTQHNGAVTASSEPGKGTVFEVYLPALKSQSAAKEIGKQPATPKGNREHILYVDDEAPLVKIAKVMLAKLGYRVTGFSNSKEALKHFKTQPGMFDMVITDMTMPDMNGDLLAKEIKRIRPDIPVLLCSGYSKLLKKEQSGPPVFEDIIIKPIQEHILGNAIRKILSRNP